MLVFWKKSQPVTVGVDMNTAIQQTEYTLSPLKTVETGLIRTDTNALQELARVNIWVGELGKDVLENMRYDHHPQVVELVQLRFPSEGGNTYEMHQTAWRNNLVRCTPEQVVMLFLQNQDMRKWSDLPKFRIPILDSKSDNLYMTLKRGELWTETALSTMGWNNKIPWVYARSRHK